MADIAIRATATAAAPRDYTIPGAQEILPKAITATYDGTGAAGQFFPCLEVLDPGGNVMVAAVGSAAMSPGASADVSWFPGLGAGGASATASGAWTQVFHFDVPALASPTSIDTTGSTWSNANNNIFGLFIGKSMNGAHNDLLELTVNSDGLGHYGKAIVEGTGFLGVGSVDSFGNVLDVNGYLGRCGAAGDSLGTTALQFVIPKIYQGTQTGKIISYGGYAGLVSGAQEVAVTSYEFSTITSLQLFFLSGSAFEPGSSLTLWTV